MRTKSCSSCVRNSPRCSRSMARAAATKSRYVLRISSTLAQRLPSEGPTPFGEQTLLPTTGPPKAAETMAGPSSVLKSAANTQKTTSGTSKPSKVAPNKLVRTDAQSQTLDALFPVTSRASTSKARNGTVPATGEGVDAAASDGDEARPSKVRRSDHDPAFAARLAADQAAQARARVRIAQSECALTSVKQLRKEVIEARHEGARGFLLPPCGAQTRRDFELIMRHTRLGRYHQGTHLCWDRRHGSVPVHVATSDQAVPGPTRCRRVRPFGSSPERALLCQSC